MLRWHPKIAISRGLLAFQRGSWSRLRNTPALRGSIGDWFVWANHPWIYEISTTPVNVIVAHSLVMYWLWFGEHRRRIRKSLESFRSQRTAFSTAQRITAHPGAEFRPLVRKLSYVAMVMNISGLGWLLYSSWWSLVWTPILDCEVTRGA